MTTPHSGAEPPRTRHPDPLPHDRYRWTPAKALAFLDALGQHGNVAQAARSVGMTRQSAYRLRDRSLTVAQAWPMALSSGMAEAAQVPTQAEVRRAAAQRRQADAAWFAGGLPWLQGDTAATPGDSGAPAGAGARCQDDTPRTHRDRAAMPGDGW